LDVGGVDMKKQLDELFSMIFGGALFLAMALGFLCFVLFFLGFIIGGDTAAAFAQNAKKVIDYAIQISSIAVLFGLLKIYVSGKHYLTIMDEDNPERKDNSIKT
jgi:hypothetical protein